jgi:hypothetical protein
MKQASSRELFGYWTAKRGSRAAPERGEIEPSAIRRALGDVFILEFDRLHAHPFRLAGTRVCALFGRELKNEAFLALWETQSRLSLADLMDTVADEANGIVASANGVTAEGWTQDVEMVLLPLMQRGDRRARLIGSLAPLSAPFWLGQSKIATLTLGNIRHLNPAIDGPPAARLVAGEKSAIRRASFVVHEGGRR